VKIPREWPVPAEEIGEGGFISLCGGKATVGVVLRGLGDHRVTEVMRSQRIPQSSVSIRNHAGAVSLGEEVISLPVLEGNVGSALLFRS